MKALICERYGPPEVLKIQELPQPVPGDSDVLVRVHAATVTKYDCWQRSAMAPTGFGWLVRLINGVLKPKQPVLGTEFSGVVESVGQNVTKFKAGDEVYGYPGMKLGAYAEFVCMPEDGAITQKPANVSFEEAAASLQGALTALFFLRKGGIEKGKKLLVYGASGGVGNAAVQLAKHFGADVTGVCSTSKIPMVKSIGADHVIDYTKEDFILTGQTWDIILDTIARTPVSRCKNVLVPDGYYLMTTFGIPQLTQLLWFSLTSGRNIGIGTLKETPEDMLFLKGLIETGELHTRIDRVFPMDEAVEAHRYVESGKKQGNVVIKMA